MSLSSVLTEQEVGAHASEEGRRDRMTHPALSLVGLACTFPLFFLALLGAELEASLMLGRLLYC